MEVLSEQLPLTFDIASSYSNGTNEEQKFVSNFAQLLGTFLKEHSALVEITFPHPDAEQQAVKQAHLMALKYLLKVSEVEDVEVFKVVMEKHSFH